MKRIKSHRVKYSTPFAHLALQIILRIKQEKAQ